MGRWGGGEAGEKEEQRTPEQGIPAVPGRGPTWDRRVCRRGDARDRHMMTRLSAR